MIRRLLVAAFAVVTLLANVPARGAFTTIVNSPPDAIAPGSAYGVNTQINLYPGATASPGDVIYLGGFEAPAENVELNVLGGDAWSVQAWTGSQLNVSAGAVNAANLLGGHGAMTGGVVQTWSLFAEGRLEMSGGVANSIYTAGVESPVPDASYFIMSGGHVGLLDATGDVVIQGGTVDKMSFRGAGAVALIGGEIGDEFEVGNLWIGLGAFADEPPVVPVSGRVSVRGGSIGDRMVLRNGKTLDYSGGIIGDAFHAQTGSRVRIRGSQFFINGIELTWPAGQELVLTQRDVTLTGLLADGQPFEFDLHSQAGQGDFFSPDASVAIMLVPEPGAAAMTAVLFVAFAVNSRWRRAGKA